MITKEVISEGLDKGIINIVRKCDILHDSGWHEDTELVCQIGEYWFYFDDTDSEFAESVTSYLINISKEELVENIFFALNDLKLCIEYKYYEYVLQERLKSKKNKKDSAPSCTSIHFGFAEYISNSKEKVNV